MEGPLKRKRPSLSSGDGDDPADVDLQEARAQNDLRLKSIFEGIFEKYGRDFTDVGDEIDLETGDILVNNGHIQALEEGSNPEAIGDIGDWLSNPDSQIPSNERVDFTEKDAVRGRLDTRGTDNGVPEENGDHPGRKVGSMLSQLLLDPENRREIMDSDENGTASEAEDDRSSLDSLLDTALCIQDTRSQGVGTDEATTEKANPQPEGSNQSEAELMERLDETVDPVWRVPEISAKFTTPTQLSRSRPKSVIRTRRSQSPPGAGSLWALPRSSTRETDVLKRRQQKDSPKKGKKHQSSPVVCDWSFADAPDGSESDDPLQEAYKPSPTPKGALYIREKRKGPFSASGTKNTCSYCKKSFSQEGYVTHLRAVLSDPADNQHDLIQLKRQLDSVTGSRATGQAPDATATARSPVRSANTPTAGFESKEGQETHHESTPTMNKRARTALGPDEAKLIIQLKHVEEMKWKDIMDHFPQKKLSNIQAWHHTHWKSRRSNPPQPSGPWSEAELEVLEKVKDQPGLTWPGIRAEMPGRLHAEIEFKLLQIWAGDDVDHT
ncbi:hypothetical protein BDV12DRAFT_152923 [Aspergillus spectabilis]